MGALSTQFVQESDKVSIQWILDGGGSALADGWKADSILRIPWDFEITEAEMLGDQTGTITVKILKFTYDEYDAGVVHPVDGDDITNGGLQINTGVKTQDLTLSGWTTNIAKDDYLCLDVDGAATSTQTVALSIKGRRKA